MTIQVPGQVAINVESMQGKLAHPHHIAGQTAGGVRILTIGGLTKLEHAACLIAADLAGVYVSREMMRDPSLGEEAGDPIQEIARNATAIAAAVLAAAAALEYAGPAAARPE